MIITSAQYEALVQPVPPPTSEELFEYQRTKLTEAQLAPIGMFDAITTKQLPSGLFLLVPPQPTPIKKLDWVDLMSRIELNGKKGRTYVSGHELSDETLFSLRPTVLKSVEDGRGRLNTRLSDSLANIKKEGRHAYTAWQGYIHILLFPSVLNHHTLDILLSRFGSSFWLRFCLCDSGPALDYRSECANPFWGAPSCGEVEEL